VSKIQRFYDEQSLYEWERRERHRMEFTLNMRLLAEHLPPPPNRVADVGGGPERVLLPRSSTATPPSVRTAHPAAVRPLLE
jgi:hypothetical protein